MSMSMGDGGAWSGIRATLFGDLPHERWPEGHALGSPWTSFDSARDHLRAGDVDLAIRAWAAIANPVAGHDSRHVLQAWHFLRGEGVAVDPSIAREPLGVVAEVAVGDGHDVLAAYRDGSVRYLNHAGSVSVLDPGIAQEVGARRLDHAVTTWLVTAGRMVDRLASVAGPFSLPDPGSSRFTVLTCGGHRVVEGREPDLASAPFSGDLLTSGVGVLHALPRPS